MVAHELFLIYLRAIETDVSGLLHFGTVYNRGNGDTYLKEARQNAAVFFRTGGGTPPAIEGLKKVAWNGKSTPNAAKPCVAFNLGTPHRADSLDADGTCKYGHYCMQWVSDKGRGGMCGACEHGKLNCDYEPSLRLSKPLN